MSKLLNRLICKYRGHDLTRPKTGHEFTQKKVKCKRCGKYCVNRFLPKYHKDISDIVAAISLGETPFFTTIRNSPLSKKSYEWKDIFNDNIRKI